MPTEAGVVPRGGKEGIWKTGVRTEAPYPLPALTAHPLGTHKGVLSHLSRTFTSTSRCSSRYLGGRSEPGSGQGHGLGEEVRATGR